MNGNLTRVAIPLENGKKPYVMLELDEREFAAIGFAVSQWALLEAQILFATKLLHEMAGTKAPTDATQDSFRRRLRAFTSALEAVKEAKIYEIWSPLSGKIARENGIRQALTHGVWAYDHRDVDQLHAHLVRGGEAGKPQRLPKEALFSFAERVGEIIFILMYPGGKDQWLEEHAAGGVSVSRSFLREVVTKRRE